MKSTAVLSTFLLLAAGLQLALAQQQGATDCRNIAAALGTTEVAPVTVPNLPVCEDERAVPQCCVVDFILERLNVTEEDFLEGLRDQLRERFQNFEDIANRLRQFLEGDFLTRYFASIGDFSILGGGSGFVNEFISDLRDNLEFDPRDDDDDDGMDEEDTSADDDEESTTRGGFNIRGFLRNITAQLEDRAIQRLTQSVQTGQCIRRVVEGRIAQQKMEAQAEALQQIRRVLASIENLRSFLRNFTEDLAGFRPLQQCIDRIVDLNTCGRCVAVRQPFCRNVCAAIARACYSPFNDALEDQMEVLWEVVRRILDRATDAIEELNENRGFLDVDNAALIRQIATECDVTFPVGRRQADDDNDNIPFLPAIIRSTASRLRGGPFDDDDDDDDDEDDERGPGICRRLIARPVRGARCWDGDRDRDTDIDDFDFDDIDSQVNNPVIDLDEDELREQATALGMPVSAALSDPSFAEVAPQGLVIPEPGAGDGNNGAASAVFSFTLLTLALVAGVFMM